MSRNNKNISTNDGIGSFGLFDFGSSQFASSSSSSSSSNSKRKVASSKRNTATKSKSFSLQKRSRTNHHTLHSTEGAKQREHMSTIHKTKRMTTAAVDSPRKQQLGVVVVDDNGMKQNTRKKEMKNKDKHIFLSSLKEIDEAVHVQAKRNNNIDLYYNDYKNKNENVLLQTEMNSSANDKSNLTKVNQGATSKSRKKRRDSNNKNHNNMLQQADLSSFFRQPKLQKKQLQSRKDMNQHCELVQKSVKTKIEETQQIITKSSSNIMESEDNHNTSTVDKKSRPEPPMEDIDEVIENETKLFDKITSKQQNTKYIPSRNIASFIYNREIRSNQKKFCPNLAVTSKEKHHYHYNNSRKLTNYAQKQWKVYNNVELELNRNQSEITAMKFDIDGILLAVSDTMGYIQIFDFDEVNAAYLRAECSQKRQGIGNGNDQRNREKAVKIGPFLTFFVGNHRISCMEWCPDNDNLLAVSFFNRREVCVYDISSTSNTGPLVIRLVEKGRPSNHSNGTTVLKFLANDEPGKSKLCIGGEHGLLRLWEISSINITKSNQRNHTVLWSMNVVDEKITSIVHVNPSANDKDINGIIMIATSYGSFVLLNMNRCSRKSFSSSKTPQKLSIWRISSKSHDFKNFVLPSTHWLGVKSCYIKSVQTSMETKNHLFKLCVDTTVCLISGWVLFMYFDMGLVGKHGNWKVQHRFQVIHKPPDMIYWASEEDKLVRANASVCLPEFATPTASPNRKSPFIMIADVKQVDVMVPSIDKRVIGATWSMRREGDCDRILIIDQQKIFPSAIDDQQTSKNKVSAISLPKGTLRNIEVHPDSQWTVLSFTNYGELHCNSITLMKQIGENQIISSS